MSLLSNILKIGGAGLGVAAIPFTGGASAAALPWLTGGSAALTSLGNVAGNAAQGSADQRVAENSQMDRRNSILAQLYGAQQNASQNALLGQSREQSDHAGIDLDRRRYALAAPSARASQSVRGSILKNAQPASLSGLPDRVASHVPTLNGGLTPAMFSGDTRQLGDELTRSALMDQLKGDTFDPLQKTDFQSGVLAPPKLGEYQNAGAMEKIMGGTGLIASILAALDGAGGKRQPAQAGVSHPYDEDV